MAGNRRHIPDDQKLLVLQMLERGQTTQQARQATGFALSTIKRLRKNHRLYGTVSKPVDVRGRRPVINETVLDVCCSSQLRIDESEASARART